MGLDGYMMRWNLTPGGAAIRTTSSDLMVWLDGQGAAQVFRKGGRGLLMERLHPEPALAEMALGNQDSAATRTSVQRSCTSPSATP